MHPRYILYIFFTLKLSINKAIFENDSVEIYRYYEYSIRELKRTHILFTPQHHSNEKKVILIKLDGTRVKLGCEMRCESGSNIDERVIENS
jgi:hypothetical protein